MKYSMGECLAEYGFNFYEKLHEPIFLVNKIGRIIKINEAGRKFMRIARLSIQEIEARLLDHLSAVSKELGQNTSGAPAARTTLVNSKNRRLHLITAILPKSDYYLLEVRR